MAVLIDVNNMFRVCFTKLPSLDVQLCAEMNAFDQDKWFCGIFFSR